MPNPPKKVQRLNRTRRSRALAIETLEDRTTPGAGDLDTTFGQGGKVTTDLGSPNDVIFHLTIDDAGRILAIGSSGDVSNSDFILARYLPDGSLDATFGTGGVVRTDLGGSEVPVSGVIDSAHRIVLAGHRFAANQNDIALVRYLPDGSLDSTFGNAGVVLTNFTSDDSAQTVAIDAENRIVIAGHVIGDRTWYDFVVARYLPNGELDSSFGSGGKVFLNFQQLDGSPSAGAQDGPSDIDIDDAGRILVAGYSNRGFDFDVAMVRYLPDGSLDPSFGTNGKVLTDYVGGRILVQAMTRDTANNILLAGLIDNGQNTDFVLARYLANGTPDASFGTAGFVVTSYGAGADEFYDVIIDSAERIVAVGTATTAGDRDFAIARYTSQGILDQSFGNGGLVLTPFTGDYDLASAVAMDGADRIVIGGASGDTSTLSSPNAHDFGLARYHNEHYPAAILSAGDLIYTEGDPTTPIDDQLVLVEGVNSDLIGATVRVENFRPDQDVVGFTLLPGITGTFDPAVGQLILTGTASFADYQAVLRSVTYRNTSNAPDTQPRTFIFTLDDGSPDAGLGASRKVVEVRSVNEAPTLGGVPSAATVVRGSTLAFTATATDPDSSGLTFHLVGAPAGATIDTATGVFSWTPGGTVTPGEYTFEVTVSDDFDPPATTGQTITVRVPWASVVAGDLVVGGTSRSDVLAIVPEGNPDRIALIVHGQVVETFDRNAITGRVIVRGLGGADLITIHRDLLLPADLQGGDGNDTLVGGAGDDQLDGGASADQLSGRGGADILIGGQGNDKLAGGLGDDSYEFANRWGVDAITETATGGNDTLDLSAVPANANFSIGAGVRAAAGAHAVSGAGVENLVGGTGNDTFKFASGGKVAGSLDGGPGVNALNYSGYLTPVTVNLKLGTATGTAGITNLQHVTGGAASDILVGDAASNKLTGGGGNDILIGGGGIDALSGGAGQDLLFGGSTIHDSNAVALSAIRKEWTRLISYSTRINHLLGTEPGGLNGTTLLDAAGVLDDSGAVDSLAGGIGRDWFLTFAGDGVMDQAAGETVTAF